MPPEFTPTRFEIVNLQQVRNAFLIAPRDMRRGIVREMNRVRSKYLNAARRELFSGRPGIHLPAVERARGIKASGKGKRGKESARGQTKSIQLAHILAKVIDGKNGVFIFASYTSRFVTFHPRVKPLFEAVFDRFVGELRVRLNKEVVRLAQLAIDRRLPKFVTRTGF